MAADVDEATNASHMRTTMILPTPTGILLRTSGNASGRCVHMSFSYETAAVVAAEVATRAIRGATRIEPQAVYLQRIRTQTIPPTRRMCRQTSRSCPKSLSKDLRTVGVSAMALTIPDSERRPMVHVQYKAIISSARRSSSKQHNPKDTTPGFIGVNEIDNHADTTCAGPNWRLIELTGEYCTVSPFSSEYQPKPDVPIAKCATTYTCPTTGDSVVLVADQVLWFANGFHCSLINPHQIWAYGYSICDDPWDPHRPLGIDLGSIFVPLTVSGPNLSFESRVPTDWEMSNLPIVEIT
jgi:hypothetical protein